jgi:hypothetical protein
MVYAVPEVLDDSNGAYSQRSQMVLILEQVVKQMPGEHSDGGLFCVRGDGPEQRYGR